jgi:hypothetical protein
MLRSTRPKSLHKIGDPATPGGSSQPCWRCNTPRRLTSPCCCLRTHLPAGLMSPAPCGAHTPAQGGVAAMTQSRTPTACAAAPHPRTICSRSRTQNPPAADTSPPPSMLGTADSGTQAPPAAACPGMRTASTRCTAAHQLSQTQAHHSACPSPHRACVGRHSTNQLLLGWRGATGRGPHYMHTSKLCTTR